MKPQQPDDSLNIEDSGTLELDRPTTARQPTDTAADEAPPELSGNRRQGDTKSRELLTNPFDVPGVG